MFCRNCGAEVKETAKFCPKCGTAQETVVQAPSRNNSIVQEQANINTPAYPNNYQGYEPQPIPAHQYAPSSGSSPVQRDNERPTAGVFVVIGLNILLIFLTFVFGLTYTFDVRVYGNPMLSFGIFNQIEAVLGIEGGYVFALILYIICFLIALVSSIVAIVNAAGKIEASSLMGAPIIVSTMAHIYFFVFFIAKAIDLAETINSSSMSVSIGVTGWLFIFSGCGIDVTAGMARAKLLNVERSRLAVNDNFTGYFSSGMRGSKPGNGQYGTVSFTERGWTCAVCGKTNGSNMKTCNCGQRRPYVESMDKHDNIAASRQSMVAQGQRIQSPTEWLCPQCGRVNQHYVGTCGCGQRKP